MVAVVPAPSKWNRRPTGASSDRLPQVGDGRSAGRIDKELEERLEVVPLWQSALSVSLFFRSSLSILPPKGHNTSHTPIPRSPF